MGQLHLPHDSGSCTEVLAVTKYNPPPTQSAVLIMSRDIEAASVATPPHLIGGGGEGDGII